MSKPALPAAPAPATRAPAWAPWLLVAWALASLLALIWLDWQAALRGILCLPRG